MKTRHLLSVCALLFCATTLLNGQSIKSDIDALASEMYPKDGPGAVILVSKDGETIYKNAFGQSSVELGIPMRTENVLELGSITKQFTAIAVLMLQEQGKLAVQDPITKFIPDYPTLGKTITVHHLLTHTSGIRNYTAVEKFLTLARTDISLDELIDAFKNEPMDFDPGEAFNYSNSGYVILGKVIEVASGETYEDFIEQRIFAKLGMKNSRYGDKSELILNRAQGYQPYGDGYKNADYLSMTIPHAAGSLMSTVEDMSIWQNELRNPTLLKKSNLALATNGSTLNNGDHIPYGYGLGETSVRGEEGYAHSGGIFGYTTNGIYLEDQDIYVIGLSNCTCKDIGGLTDKIAAIAMGNPYPNYRDAMTLSTEQLEKWVGTYKFTDDAIRYVQLKDGLLVSTREGSTAATPFKIHPLRETHFVFEDGMNTYDFKIINGKRQATFTRDGQAPIIGSEIDKKAPAIATEITLDPDVLQPLEGVYEVMPSFKITVRSEGSKLFAQATGQPEFELFAKNENSFFLKVVPASVDFDRDDKGNVTKLILHQGGQDIPAVKIE